MEFLVPDYYTSFRCKIGQCRSVCCAGWPVTFSMKDYFRLLSVDCSPEIKRRLDTSLHLTPNPTEEEYGMLLPRFDGDCPVHLADGRCGLQAEAGEAALPAVCRLYPRSVQAGECCCANSCEAVIECLDRDEPVRFQTIQQDMEIPPRKRTHVFESDGREKEIRMWLIAYMQDRRFPLNQRLHRLNAALKQMSDALTQHDAAIVRALLSGELQVDPPDIPDDRRGALSLVRQLLEKLDTMSDSIRSYGELALDHFEKEGSISDEMVTTRLTQMSPRWENWFENIMVNHMFFVQFPFQDRPVSLVDETIALNAVYALLRFLVIGAGNGTRESLVDIAAALFRLVDHTAFDRYAVSILKGIDDSHTGSQLLSI